MGVLRRGQRRITLSFATVAFLLLATVSALGFTTAHQFMRRILAEGEMARRRLSGPGSWPPSCTGKCGWCAPCKAVHVPIQPGMSMPLEYYPEAWRCKCGNKLFMP